MMLPRAERPPLPPSPALPRLVAAWLASLAVHLAFAALGYVVFPASLPPDRGPPIVHAGIVLARRTDTKTLYVQDPPPLAGPLGKGGAGDAPHQVLRPVAEADFAAEAPWEGVATLPDAREMPALAGFANPPRVGIGMPEAPHTDWPQSLSAIRTAGGRPRLPVSQEDTEAILAEDANMARDEPPPGPTASLSLFGLPPAVGRSFVLLIDRSQSMGSAGLDVLRAAAEELQRQLASLTPQQTVQVVAYNDVVVYGTGPHLAPATPEHRAALVAFVAHLPAYGQTEHTRGLLAALRLRPEVVFLLTDGGDPIPDGHQLQLVRRLAAGRTQIHCLHFGRGPADERAGFLQRLARESGGQYRYFELSRARRPWEKQPANPSP